MSNTTSDPHRIDTRYHRVGCRSCHGDTFAVVRYIVNGINYVACNNCGTVHYGSDFGADDDVHDTGNRDISVMGSVRQSTSDSTPTATSDDDTEPVPSGGAVGYGTADPLYRDSTVGHVVNHGIDVATVYRQSERDRILGWAAGWFHGWNSAGADRPDASNFFVALCDYLADNG